MRVKKIVWSAGVMALLAVSGAQAQDPSKSKGQVDAMLAHEQRLSTALRNVFDMMPGLMGVEWQATQDAVDSISKFRGDLAGAEAIGVLIAQMKCPHDLDRVRSMFEVMAKPTIVSSRDSVRIVNRQMATIGNAAVLAELTTIREETVAIGDIVRQMLAK